MKILFLPRWYPDRNDPMPGLFVQRQAEAVSVHCVVSVLYVSEDKNCKKTYEPVVCDESGIRVIRVYFRPSSSSIPFLSKLVNGIRFLEAHRIGFRQLGSEKPDLVHVHVMTREAVIAFLYRMFTGIPYVITEHWSRYFPQNGTYKGILRKALTRMVVRHASAVVAVSEKLKQAMQDQRLRHSEFHVIPNPVDMDLFTPIFAPGNKTGEKKQIIHISCFEDKSKNLSGFLKVLRKLSESRKDFTCSLIGEGPDRDEILRTAAMLDFPEGMITLPGLLTGEKLVNEIRLADFLVLSSHYETFGTVIIECLACGTPVVASDVGIAGSVINAQNGILVPPSDGSALEKAVSHMLDVCRIDYDRTEVHNTVSGSFSNNSVGNRLFSLYRSVMLKN